MTALEEQMRVDVDALLRAYPVASTPDVVIRGARFDAGLAFVHFDEGLGGRGLDPGVQAYVEGLFLAAGCVDWSARNVIGLGMAAPTLAAHGTAEQRRLLRPLFTGEEVWCQLFSEPGAGSDLAALATRAVPDATSWRVDGQKVWTTLGHVARRGLLLTRTDPTAPKHRGLTAFVLDMRSPGVDVRPLRQLTGEAEFNEVYLTDVVVPDDDRLGSVGDGWRIALTTLMHERVSLGGRVVGRGGGPISLAVSTFRKAAGAGATCPEDGERLLALWSRAEAVRLTNLRAAAAVRRGVPGPEGSVSKLTMAETNQAVYAFCAQLLGGQGLLIDGYEETVPEEAAVFGGTDPVRAWLRSLANSIEGGTSQVMRNVLGERILGLPGEPRVDKDLPWNEVPRS